MKRLRLCSPWLTVLVSAPLASQSTEPWASVQSMPVARVLDAAREIDRLIDQDLARHQEPANPAIDDATFVRRAWLSIVGRIPTAAATRAFLADRSPQRRTALIDALLDAPGRASHEFNYWADLLRVKTRLAQQVSGEPYIHWLKQAIADNKPYDEFVGELLTASGPALARDNGATGYYLRDLGMPEDNMANTVRVFLGTRLECAQCHDHRFDKWKQRQFFEMVAFTGGIEYQTNDVSDSFADRIRVLAQQVRDEHGVNGQRALGQLLRPIRAGVYGDGKGVAALPQDYQYDDARPGTVVAAQTMFGQDIAMQVVHPPQARQPRGARRPAAQRRRGPPLPYPEIDSRRVYADWMTSPENPRFTKVIANRTWKRVMGVGVIEPVDDLRDDTVAANPELMEYLERLMVELDYDLKQFQRVLFNTQAFQRQSSRQDRDLDKAYRFAGPLLRRMTAEQIWDSALTLAVSDLDAKLRPPGAGAERVYEEFERLLSSPAEELRQRIEQQVLRYTDPQKFRAQQMAARARQMQEQQQRRRDRRGAAGALVRASDLPSPAPPGHFLQSFGQSDREQIETADADANVPQVLTLLNGLIESRILGNEQAVLTRELAAAKTPTDKIRSAYLAVLNREPERDELAMWLADVGDDQQTAYGDLVWTLVNTHEFRFVR